MTVCHQCEIAHKKEAMLETQDGGTFLDGIELVYWSGYRLGGLDHMAP